MSWQATEWAVKQKTGSAHRKLLLLLLANRADEDGICWPSQINLGDQSEQSPDTVQRHLKALDEGGFIRRALNRPFGGQWPGFVYQLMMPGVAAVAGRELTTKPAEKRAARAVLDASPGPLPAASTGPLPAVRPGRSQRCDQAAGSGIESSSEYSIETSQAEPSGGKATGQAVDRPRALQGESNRADRVHDRIARRLGPDPEAGHLMLLGMSPDQLARVVLLERRGRLDDQEILKIHAGANLAGSSGTRPRS